MKTILSIIVLSFMSFSVSALDLSLGVGTCNKKGEYCDSPLGHIEIGQNLFAIGNNSLRLQYNHFSNVSDGFAGGRGVDTVTINYKYTFPFWNIGKE